jgi:predicted O-linked N-acetylglucosamine transferase (SPINDLY family)
LDDFFPPVLRHHDRGRFDIRLFADGGREDGRTAELRALADGWMDLAGLDVAAKVERMRAADLDIAVCLTGYLPIQRVIFAPRVAPIQVAQMNHVATTGLRAFDYRITDSWLDPPGTDRWNVERLVRLDHGYVPVAPPPDAPDITSLPALANGFVTFGSFNNLSKVTSEALALWARVLTAIPSARLLFKARAFNDPGIRSSYSERFGALGIAVERIDFVGDVAGHHEHLEVLGRADIALDPIPFAGGRTTVETLWMGVPVVNCRTQSLVGRLGSTMLVRAGLDGHVADMPEAFVAIATRLATDLGSLSEMRHGMRRRLQASMLCDVAGYTRELEDAFIAMVSGAI